MNLLLIRHAQPLRHDPAVGRADPGLSEIGRRQADRLAAWLAAEGVDAVYSSPARRAVETAAPYERLRGLTPNVEEGLAEFDRDAGSYVPVEELQAAGDERWKALAQGAFYTSDVDPVAFRERVAETLEAIVAAHPERVVVVFTHGGVINAYVGHILGIATPLWFAPHYTSISRVAAARSGRRSVVSLSETGHLHDGAA